MLFERICPPALLYLVFSITQIAIDSMKGLYNTALVKCWVTFIFTIILNYLCESGLGIVSWIIVFIPFILMTLIVAILLIMFGLDPSTGKISANNGDVKPSIPSHHHHKGRTVHYKKKHRRHHHHHKGPHSDHHHHQTKQNKHSPGILGHEHPSGTKKHKHDDYYNFLDPRQQELLDRINRYTDKRITIPGVNESAVDHKNRKKTVELGSDYEWYSAHVSKKRRDINGIFYILSDMNEDNEGAYFLNQADVCLQEENDSKCNICIKKLILRTVAKLGPNKGSIFHRRVKNNFPEYL
tara:strand:- start:517 stop:1404 length:888 start_codon:yes stop_codon:yes gene_type:complete